MPLVFQADAEARKVCDGRRGETAGPLLSSPNSGLLPWLFDKNKTGQSVDMMALELLRKRKPVVASLGSSIPFANLLALLMLGAHESLGQVAVISFF